MSEVLVKMYAIVFIVYLVYVNVFIKYWMYAIIFRSMRKSSVKKCEEQMMCKEVQMKCKWSAEMTENDFNCKKF